MEAVHHDEKKKQRFVWFLLLLFIFIDLLFLFQRNVEKLQVIYALVNGPLFEDAPSRCILTPTILKQLHLHIQSQNEEEQQMCTSILATMLHRIEVLIFFFLIFFIFPETDSPIDKTTRQRRKCLGYYGNPPLSYILYFVLHPKTFEGGYECVLFVSVVFSSEN